MKYNHAVAAMWRRHDRTGESLYLIFAYDLEDSPDHANKPHWQIVTTAALIWHPGVRVTDWTQG